MSPRSQNSSTVATEIATNISSSRSQNSIDPRFTYDGQFANQFLDKDSAYLNTLLALEDLSTKGWMSRLSYETIYSFSGYGSITVRVHASQNPSSLQYRHAIWGLYSAIRESSNHDFKACVLTLYWSPIAGKSRHKIGYVSILAAPTPSIDTGNSNKDALKHTLPILPRSLINFTTADGNATSFAIESVDGSHLSFQIRLGDRGIDVDSVFNTIYAGVLYLASFPQSQAITEPGSVKGETFRTFLRWDSITIQAQPFFEYRYAVAALSAMAVYMYERAQFQDVRVFTYVDGMEVGVCWLYKYGIGDVLDAK